LVKKWGSHHSLAIVKAMQEDEELREEVKIEKNPSVVLLKGCSAHCTIWYKSSDLVFTSRKP